MGIKPKSPGSVATVSERLVPRLVPLAVFLFDRPLLVCHRLQGEYALLALQGTLVDRRSENPSLIQIGKLSSRSGEDLREFLVGSHQVVDRSPQRVRPFLLYRVPLRIPSIALRMPWAMFLNASSLFVHVVTGRRSIGSP